MSGQNSRGVYAHPHPNPPPSRGRDKGAHRARVRSTCSSASEASAVAIQLVSQRRLSADDSPFSIAIAACSSVSRPCFLLVVPGCTSIDSPTISDGATGHPFICCSSHVRRQSVPGRGVPRGRPGFRSPLGHLPSKPFPVRVVTRRAFPPAALALQKGAHTHRSVGS